MENDAYLKYELMSNRDILVLMFAGWVIKKTNKSIGHLGLMLCKQGWASTFLLTRKFGQLLATQHFHQLQFCCCIIMFNMNQADFGMQNFIWTRFMTFLIVKDPCANSDQDYNKSLTL